MTQPSHKDPGEIRISLSQPTRKPVTLSLEVKIDYESSRESCYMDVYEAFIPKLKELMSTMEVIH